MLDSGRFFDLKKWDSIGRTKHPIRMKKALVEHFIAQFKVSRCTATIDMILACLIFQYMQGSVSQ